MTHMLLVVPVRSAQCAVSFVWPGTEIAGLILNMSLAEKLLSLFKQVNGRGKARIWHKLTAAIQYFTITLTNTQTNKCV